jgi:enolase
VSYLIEQVRALEILDSRGRPTLQVTVGLSGGVEAVAGVPSGASTGTRDAVELRDGDPDRYDGAAVLRAVASVTGQIADLLIGRRWGTLAEVDQAMIEPPGR